MRGLAPGQEVSYHAVRNSSFHANSQIVSKGQLAIPKPIRERLRLHRGDELVIRVEGETVILERPARQNWLRWEGQFAGLDLLGDRARERQDEMTRETAKATP